MKARKTVTTKKPDPPLYPPDGSCMNPPKFWHFSYAEIGGRGVLTGYLWASSWYHARAGAESLIMSRKPSHITMVRERIKLEQHDTTMSGLTPPKPVKIAVIRLE